MNLTHLQENYNNMYKARFDDETTNEYTNSLMHAQRVEADTNSGGLDAFDGQTLTEFRIYIYNGSGSSLDISKSNTKVKFFNMGPKTKWQEYLSDEIIEEINTKFKDEMIELGYL